MSSQARWSTSYTFATSALKQVGMVAICAGKQITPNRATTSEVNLMSKYRIR